MTSNAIPVSSLPIDKAKALAAQAIDMLVSHGIPPTPLNYSVAYEYFGGASAELHQALDDYLRSGKGLDELLLRDLYDKHIASDRFKHLRGMGNDLQNILHNLMQSVDEAGDGATVFGQTLDENIGQLGSDIGPVALRSIAANILSATLDARARNNDLRQRLESTREETESLKAELERHRREALIDPLTDLFNRRAMDAHLEELMATEAGDAVSVLMMDIDHFKRINDTYGHAVGDVVIRNVAEIIRKCIRGDDIAVRYGGEEFIVLLPSTLLDVAVRVAESIRSRIESLRLVRRHDNFSLAPFTISLGVATRRHEDTPASLIQRADEALYQSKNAGRNRVTPELCLA
jgi:diguanylate cyclase